MVSIAPFCNDMMRQLESNPITRVVWSSVKPLLMGHILYAPDSQATRKIIKNVSCSLTLLGVRGQGLVTDLLCPCT